MPSASSRQRARHSARCAALESAQAAAERFRASGQAEFELFESVTSEAIARKESFRGNRCPRCWHDREQRCICSWLPSDLRTRMPIKVIVLMHHKEYLSAGDDAKLLLAILPRERAELFVFGRAGDWERLEAELAIDPVHTLLLWPGDGASTVDDFASALPATSPWASATAARGSDVEPAADGGWPLLRVVVLDGVYAHARGMFRSLRKRSPNCPPHVALHPSTLSVYHRATKGYARDSSVTTLAGADPEALRICTVEAAALLFEELGEPRATTSVFVAAVVSNNEALAGCRTVGKAALAAQTAAGGGVPNGDHMGLVPNGDAAADEAGGVLPGGRRARARQRRQQAAVLAAAEGAAAEGAEAVAVVAAAVARAPDRSELAPAVSTAVDADGPAPAQLSFTQRPFLSRRAYADSVLRRLWRTAPVILRTLCGVLHRLWCAAPAIMLRALEPTDTERPKPSQVESGQVTSSRVEPIPGCKPTGTERAGDAQLLSREPPVPCTLPSREPSAEADVPSVRALAACYVGVKPFERALVALLESPRVPPPARYTHPLRQPPRVGVPMAATATAATASTATPDTTAAGEVDWASLHPALHPSSAGVPASRAERKAWQLESLISMATLLAPPRPCHLVDFAGGTGVLGLPLAGLLPHATITIVELKARSLDIARRRAAEASLTNVRFYLGDICAFDQPFDVGLALHACGTASDLVMQACVAARARFVVCPCCTGKLSAERRDVYRYAVTGDNKARVRYPRSSAVAATLSEEEYNFLVCAADVSDAGLLRGPRGVLRRLCKAYLEHDRALWAIEDGGYVARVTTMHRDDASPKADILYGWLCERPPPDEAVARLSLPDDDHAYTQFAQLHRPNEPPNGAADGAADGATDGAADGCAPCTGGEGDGGTGRAIAELPMASRLGTQHPVPMASRLGGVLAASEWDANEIEQVTSQLRQLRAGQSALVEASSARKRRLVHYVATTLGMYHETVPARDRAHPTAVQVRHV